MENEREAIATGVLRARNIAGRPRDLVTEAIAGGEGEGLCAVANPVADLDLVEYRRMFSWLGGGQR